MFSTTNVFCSNMIECKIKVFLVYQIHSWMRSFFLLTSRTNIVEVFWFDKFLFRDFYYVPGSWQNTWFFNIQHGVFRTCSLIGIVHALVNQNLVVYGVLYTHVIQGRFRKTDDTFCILHTFHKHLDRTYGLAVRVIDVVQFSLHRTHTYLLFVIFE